jgi:hypothetical protein
MDPLLRISIINLLLSVLFATQLKPGRLKSFCLTLTVFGIFLVILHKLIHWYTGAGINEAFFFHLAAKLEQTVALFWKVTIGGILATCIMTYVAIVLARKDTVLNIFHGRQIITGILGLIFPLSAIAFNPAPLDIKRYFIESRIGFIEDHVLNIPEFFTQVKAPSAKLKVERPKNFLYIYAENLEKKIF